MTHTPKSLSALAAALITFGLFAGRANAAIVVQFSEVGSDVVVTYTGSVDLASTLGKEADRMLGFTEIWGSPTINRLVNTVAGSIEDYNLSFTAASQFANGGQFPGVGSGDAFLIESGGSPIQSFHQIWVPYNYVSGAPINGMITFTGQSFASIGILEGTHVWTWENGGVSDSATFTTVPEASSALLIGLGVLGLAATRSRKIK